MSNDIQGKHSRLRGEAKPMTQGYVADHSFEHGHLKNWRSLKKSFALYDVAASDLIGGLAVQTDDAEAPENVAVGDVIGYLTAAVSGRAAAVPRESRQSALASRAKAFIEQHLGDPGLSPSQVAEACHVSLRYLQEVFAVGGHSPAGWIRERRLQNARSDLLTSDRSAAAISARWGYPNPTSFGRAFRARFGVPPSTYRTRS